MPKTAEHYQSVVDRGADKAFYPAVAYEFHGEFGMLICANGHRWDGIDPDAGCYRCATLHKLRQAGRTDCTEPGCYNLVECSDRLWAEGVRKCQMHWTREADEVTQPVCLDELITVWGVHNPRNRWNGWATPRIDAWSVMAVLATFGPDEDYEWEWQDDLSLKMVSQGEVDYPEFYHPDEDGLYGLGAFSWTWSEDTEAEELLASGDRAALVERFKSYEQDIVKALGLPDETKEV